MGRSDFFIFKYLQLTIIECMFRGSKPNISAMIYLQLTIIEFMEE